MNKLTFSVIAGVGLTVISHAEMPQYRATQFTIPWDATVTDSNSRGDVLYLRNLGTVPRAFIHRLDGTTTMLPEFFSPEGRSALPVQLDDFGNLALTVNTVVPGGSQVGIWNERDGVRMMPIPPFSVSFTMQPTDFTNSGLVSWSTFDLPGSNNARGLWNIHTNELTTFRDAASREVRLTDVSEGGYAVGHAFFSLNSAVFHPDGAGFLLKSLPGTTTPIQIRHAAVSNDGTVAGSGVYQSGNGQVQVSHVWDRHGNILESVIGQDIHYLATNGNGLIAGGHGAPGTLLVPFLYERGGQRVTLEDLVVERNFSGALLGAVETIYDNSAVFVAVGGGGVGVPETYVFLEPVPEPGTMLVLGAGLAALLRRRRAR